MVKILTDKYFPSRAVMVQICLERVEDLSKKIRRNNTLKCWSQKEITLNTLELNKKILAYLGYYIPDDQEVH